MSNATESAEVARRFAPYLNNAKSPLQALKMIAHLGTKWTPTDVAFIAFNLGVIDGVGFTMPVGQRSPEPEAERMLYIRNAWNVLIESLEMVAKS